MEIIKDNKISIQEALKILEDMIHQSTPISSSHIIAKPHMGNIQLYISDDMLDSISGSSSDIKLAKIKSKTADNTYTADIYNNEDKDPIETDVTVKVNNNQLVGTETIPNDTWFEVVKQEHGTEGNEEIFWTVIGLTRSY